MSLQGSSGFLRVKSENYSTIYIQLHESDCQEIVGGGLLIVSEFPFPIRVRTPMIDWDEETGEALRTTGYITKM